MNVDSFAPFHKFTEERVECLLLVAPYPQLLCLKEEESIECFISHQKTKYSPLQMRSFLSHLDTARILRPARIFIK